MSTTPTGYSLHVQTGAGDSALSRLGTLATEGPWEELTIVAAYASRAGAAQLAGEMLERWDAWEHTPKNVLVSFDHGNTEPEALKLIINWPETTCLVYRAEAALASRLRNLEQYFHPKIYAFSDDSLAKARAAAGVVGSCNLTGGGLVDNVEGFIQFRADQASATDVLPQLRPLGALFREGEIVDPDLIERYRKIRDQVRPPAQRVAEKTPGHYQPRVGELDATLRKALRSARCLWTSTLKIVENLGPGRPGNQIDLKKGARAFFGFREPMSTPKNTKFGAIHVRLSIGGAAVPCEARFADNHMDRMNLPLPGGSAPARYDQRVILWERLVDGTYRLQVRKSAAAWRRQSEAEGTSFHYATGGREWGFFSAPPQ